MKTTQVKWLIEEEVFSDDINPIIEEIKSQGMEVKTTRYKPFDGKEYNYYNDNDCVVVLGSINLVKQIQRKKPWIPGCFANFNNFDCLTYYAYFGEYLLNKNYYIMPLAEVKRKFNKSQSRNGSLFFRPCNGYKTFAGQLLDYDSLIREEEKYGKPELPVLISWAKDIQSEYRVFCSGNKVLGGSMYFDRKRELNSKNIEYSLDQAKSLDLNDKSLTKEQIDSASVISLAHDILQKVSWRPDKIFSMDFCISNEFPVLMEINSFSCSGWYNTNPKPIVEEASRLALEEWKEINNI